VAVVAAAGEEDVAADGFLGGADDVGGGIGGALGGGAAGEQEEGSTGEKESEGEGESRTGEPHDRLAEKGKVASDMYPERACLSRRKGGDRGRDGARAARAEDQTAMLPAEKLAMNWAREILTRPSLAFPSEPAPS
jgi:hypothetical protein